jgi:hypothetical protein
MTVGRNQRRRAAFVETAQGALATVPNRGDQHQAFEVELCTPASPHAARSFVAVGYHDLLSKLVKEATFLEAGHSITIRLPETMKAQRALRRGLREKLGLLGNEFLDPKLVTHDA